MSGTLHLCHVTGRLSYLSSARMRGGVQTLRKVGVRIGTDGTGERRMLILTPTLTH